MGAFSGWAGGGYPIVVRELLVVAASLTVEHGALGHKGFSSCSLWAPHCSWGSRARAQLLCYIGSSPCPLR